MIKNYIIILYSNYRSVIKFCMQYHCQIQLIMKGQQYFIIFCIPFPTKTSPSLTSCSHSTILECCQQLLFKRLYVVQSIIFHRNSLCFDFEFGCTFSVCLGSHILFYFTSTIMNGLSVCVLILVLVFLIHIQIY